MSLRINKTNESDVLYLILPGVSLGGSVGISKDITDKLEKAGKTWLSITYPFQDQDLNELKSQTLEAEMQEVIAGCKLISQGRRYKKIVIIAKSFGALVASKLIETFRKDYADTIDLYVLGYIFGDMNLENDFIGKLLVYQGEHDRYGNAEQVRQALPYADVIEIPGADHSFRNEKKELVYEGQVLLSLFGKLGL